MRPLRYVPTFALAATLSIASPHDGNADAVPLEAAVKEKSASIEGKLIAWRRDIHQHPELGDQETRTARLVAEHLRSLGLEVRTGVARTGVVGVLKGASRALPSRCAPTWTRCRSRSRRACPSPPRPRASTAARRSTSCTPAGTTPTPPCSWATAEVLAGMKDAAARHRDVHLPARRGRARACIRPLRAKLGRQADAGGRACSRNEARRGLRPARHARTLGRDLLPAVRATASSDDLEITVTGKQGHGGMPWNTVDPITTSARSSSGLQTVVSRKANLTASPAVVTIGTINGGTRANIVPETVQMTGTIRAYDEAVREQVHRDITTSPRRSPRAPARRPRCRSAEVRHHRQRRGADRADGAGAGARGRWADAPVPAGRGVRGFLVLRPGRPPACSSSWASRRRIRTPPGGAQPQPQLLRR